MKFAHPYQPFWRSTPLETWELDTFNACLQAHDNCTRRANVSTWVAVNGALASGDFEKGVAAAILTTGAKHAPLVRCFDFLAVDDPASLVQGIIDLGQFVPGWGSDFVKGEPDPALEIIHTAMREHFPEMSEKIRLATLAVNHAGKPLFPNAGCYTAATALVLGIPRVVCPVLFVAGRLFAWADLILQNQPAQ